MLTFYKMKIMGVPVGKTSAFPAMRDPIRSTIESRLGEEDGLFINYGMFDDSLPYTMQDDYDLSEKQELAFDAAVLENKYLRAEFVLSLGGRLWRLYDKQRKKELLTCNQEFLPCNLAIRNAWFAGGIEWNCGRRGHDANTCSSRFAAELTDPKYGQVLRIYDYSQDRKTPYQLDFMLPDDSRFLLIRVRIVNPSADVVPMYWWSNIACPITPGCRVVVPAMDTYLNKYDGGSHFITRIPMPFGEGFDHTYPENFKIVRDHFYNIPEESRKYEALFNNDGTGFIHMSTRRLQGRKLFVWGDTTGGKHWQQKLLSEGLEDYLELQAGLAKTQQECLPMPPTTAWEWLEACGGIDAKPEKIFGSWEQAVETVTELLDTLLPESEMDQILAETKQTIALRKGVLRHQGSPAAALEEMRSGKKLAPQLDFGSVSDDQSDWVDLLKNSRMDDQPPRFFIVDSAWKKLLDAAPETWKVHYHKALYYFRQKDWERALDHARSARSLRENSWTLHLQANVLLKSGKSVSEALSLLVQASERPEADAYLIKETMKLLAQNSAWEAILDLYGKLSSDDQKRPTNLFHRAAALFHTGYTAEAKAILLANGGLELPDAREGIIEITTLYQEILSSEGIPPDEQQIPLPLDYRTKLGVG